MAEANVYIRVKTSSLRSVDKLEQKIKSTERAVDQLDRELRGAFDTQSLRGISRGTTQLDKFGKEAREATRQLKALDAQSRKIRQIQAGFAGEADAPSGGGGGGGLLSGLLVSNELNKSLKKGTEVAGDLNAQGARLSAELQGQIELREKAAELTTKLKFAEGQVTRVTNQNNSIKKSGRKLTVDQVKRQIDVKEAVTAIKGEQRAVNREIEKAVADANQLAAAYDKGSDALKQQSKIIAKQKRTQKIRRSAAAGAAVASVPGQDIIQAGIAGAAIGGPKGAILAATVATTVKLAAGLASVSKDSAKAESQLNRFKIALKGVAGSKRNTTWR